MADKLYSEMRHCEEDRRINLLYNNLGLNEIASSHRTHAYSGSSQ